MERWWWWLYLVVGVESKYSMSWFTIGKVPKVVWYLVGRI